MWKQALKDAYETDEKWWFASSAAIGLKIRRMEGWMGTEKRFAFWTQRSARRCALL
ncbi:hypothetical protein KZZ20_00920 [Methylacidiphilum fumariolicum]|uniref:Uncharacterized protein n=2 Tax=Candidatus Methylacidiphilum fumarolicum TaxID=591154 RepID=I0JVS4_METFB|nr:hypothetical protein [Candidatus Methylacidiphilum fumarolicum]CAI9086535.1 conserved protein of unknown function [Candidatus Methylacidiphilum fumarolicum]CCG91343.1 hypothetical protein MFUM_1020067 [Methylacidiphilum fumariolicum SolV]